MRTKIARSPQRAQTEDITHPEAVAQHRATFCLQAMQKRYSQDRMEETKVLMHPPVVEKKRNFDELHDGCVVLGQDEGPGNRYVNLSFPKSCEVMGNKTGRGQPTSQLVLLSHRTFT